MDRKCTIWSSLMNNLSRLHWNNGTMQCHHFGLTPLRCSAVPTKNMILQLRKSISEEDKLTTKYNVRLTQAYKSNWKLKTHDENIADELNVYKEASNAETTSIDICKEHIKDFKQENKRLFDESKDKIEEKILNFEEKLINAYNEYETKYLITSTKKYHDKTENKVQDLHNVTQVEDKWRGKANVILENLSGENVSTLVHDLILIEDSDVLVECQLLKRIVKDRKLKWQQHEETIHEFSKQTSNYNF
ncbi:uncharacterized protein LOC117180360 [Belonocnema kinseyi]|uniref:uncharacterized protein LOC117180360 n=1 Tax=Belonocnema kinseyi TaxID=2817044 RepID=UPI00143CE120|nr:uncharacterized protein LOC117180360 [Belonocnema kinseyi]